MSCTPFGASGQWTASASGTATGQVAITRGQANQVTLAGPPANGIDHSQDQFILLTNPQLAVSVVEKEVSWQLGINQAIQANAQIVPVTVQQLQNPAQMSSGLASTLAIAGLTEADYATILAANPFAAGATTIDTSRYQLTAHSFPYVPPAAPGDATLVWTYSQTSATTTTQTSQAQVQIQEKGTISAGLDSVIDVLLKESGTLEWTEVSTNTNSQGVTQTASVTVASPAFGYEGPINVDVYWDTVYSSYMFAFSSGTPVTSGNISTSSGPAAGQAVTLTSGGVTWSTFTDSTGEYRFYNAAPGAGTVTAGAKQVAVNVAAAGQAVPAAPPITL